MSVFLLNAAVVFVGLGAERSAETVNVGGVVVDSEGSPIADVEVRFRAWPPRKSDGPRRSRETKATVRTDAGGVWNVPDVPADFARTTIDYNHPEYVPSWSSPEGPRTQALRDGLHEHRLQHVTKVRVRVLGATDEPVADARVMFDVGTTSSDQSRRTNKEGFATPPRVNPGEKQLVVMKAGYAPATSRQTIEGEVQNVTVRLDDGQPLEAKVVDPGGHPVADARFYRENVSLAYHALDYQVWPQKTDDRGEWTWSDGPIDGATFSVSKPGYMSVNDVRLTPEAPTTVTLRPEVVVTIIVSDAATGQPIGDWTLTPGVLIRGGVEPHWQAEKGVAVEGSVAVHRPETGYEGGYVRVMKSGYGAFVSPMIPNDAGATRIDVRLRPVETQSIPVLNPAGQPAVGVAVSFATRRATATVRTGGVVDAKDESVRRTTDGAGRFDLPSFDVPYVAIAVSEDGFGLASRQSLRDAPQIELKEWSRLEGIYNKDGEPAANAMVDLLIQADTAVSSGVHFIYSTRTDLDGRFEFARVPPGPVRVGPQIEHIENGRTLYTTGETVSTTALPGETVSVEIR